jgi:hypothetical protein
MTTTTLEINYDNVRHAGDHVMPEPFPNYDRDGNPGEGEWLGHIAHGTRIVDALGQRFLIMGPGCVQGTVVLRDRYRRMFYCDIDMRMKVA